MSYDSLIKIWYIFTFTTNLIRIKKRLIYLLQMLWKTLVSICWKLVFKTIHKMLTYNIL